MPEDRLAWYQRRADERAQARADLRAAATPAPATPEAQPTRSFGFQSGAGAPREEAGRTASLVQAANEVGAPTSFNAGAGAPVPVEVVRGMKTTYTNPAPDMGAGGGYNPSLSRNTREFVSPVQAGQAFNRGELAQDLALAAKTPGVTPNVAALNEKYGGYVPPAGPEIEARGEQQRLIQAAENKRPDLVALAEANKAEAAAKVGETNVGSLRRWLSTLPGMGTMKDGKLTFTPQDENTARAVLAAEEIARTKGVEGAKTHFLDSLKVQQFEPLFPPEQVAEGRKNPTFWRRYVLEHGPRRAAAAGPQAQPRKWWQGTPIQEQRPIDWGKVIPPATETVPPM